MTKAKNKKITIDEALVSKEDQPCELPSNWCWVKFEYLTKDMADGPFGSNLKTEHYTEKPEVRIIQLSNVAEGAWRDDNKKYTTFDHAKTISRSIVEPGNIVVTKMMPAGRAMICPNDEKMYVLSSDNIKVVPQDIIDTKFMEYGINSQVFNIQVIENTQGITRARTSIKKIKGCAFPLPPLAEQQRIVERIESLFSKLDEAKERVQGAIDSFNNRRVMILRKAFDGSLTEKWRKNNVQSISKWDRKILSECASAIGDGLHGTPVYTESEEYYFINGNNLEYDHIEYKSDTKTVNKTEYDKYYIELNDATVLVSINGTLGKTAFYNNEPVILGKSACYINTTEILDKYYLRYFFNTKEFIDYANEKATGSTIKNLGLKAIRMLEINVPSLEEQKEIVRLLDGLLIKEREAKEVADAVIASIDLMKKSILAEAFRGELGTNNPQEESAIELLNSIL